MSLVYLPWSQNTRLGVYLIEVKKQQALSPKVRIKRFTSGPQRHNNPCVFKTLMCLPFGAASTFVQNTLSGKQFCVRLCNLPPSWTHFLCTLWSIIFPPKNTMIFTRSCLFSDEHSKSGRITRKKTFSHEWEKNEMGTNWQREKVELLNHGLVCQMLYRTDENNY